MFVPSEYKGTVKTVTNSPVGMKEYLFDEYLFQGGIPPEEFQMEFEIMAGLYHLCFTKSYDRMFVGL